jgi:signal transduction histidine kinase
MNDPSHVWNRTVIGWHIAFWSFLSSAVIVLATAGDLGPGRRLLGFGVVAVLGISFAGLRPVSVDPGPRTLTYLLLVILSCGVAVAVDPDLSLLLFVAYSQMWLYARSIRQSLWLVLGLTLSSTLGFLSAGGWKLREFWVIGPTMGTSLVFTVLFGVWVSRIIDQSRDRAELISELETTRAELGAAHHAQGVVAERERMAREIHDTLAQGYTSIIMLAQAASAAVELEGRDVDTGRLTGRLDMIEEVARENLGEARALVAAFGPVGLDGTTLVEAVHRLGNRFAAETGLAIDVLVSGQSSQALAALSRDREVVLLRAAQEALTNVRRHARARLVTVCLVADGVDAWVEVVDDGIGFDPAPDPALDPTLNPARAPSRSTGFGLTGMRARAQDAGGELQISSTAGHGTRVRLKVPLVAPATS